MATSKPDQQPQADQAAEESAEEQIERLRIVGNTVPADVVVMNNEVAAKLREPFKDTQIGKLPRVTCPDCRKAQTKVCSKHEKRRCAVCHGWLTSEHLHLDYAGHAAVTDRLLAVDPYWTWEPFALTDEGLPAFDPYNGLWIRLTIAGVVRPGYGDATNSGGIKEVIGDALRNGAMRFGVGLDLWSKEDLHSLEEAQGDPPAAGASGGAEPKPAAASGSGGATGGAASKPKTITKAQVGHVWKVARAAGLADLTAHEIAAVVTGGVTSFNDIPKDSMDDVTQAFNDYALDTEKGDVVIAGWRKQNESVAAVLDKAEAERIAAAGAEGTGDGEQS